MEQVRDEVAAEEDAAARKIQEFVREPEEAADVVAEESQDDKANVRFADTTDEVVAEIPEDRT